MTTLSSMLSVKDGRAAYDSRTLALMAILYRKIQALPHPTAILEWTPDLAHFREELIGLELNGCLRSSYTAERDYNFEAGIRFRDPEFIIDLEERCGDSAKSIVMSRLIEASEDVLSGRELQRTTGLSLTIIKAFFDRYARRNLGYVTNVKDECQFMPVGAPTKPGVDLRQAPSARSLNRDAISRNDNPTISASNKSAEPL